MLEFDFWSLRFGTVALWHCGNVALWQSGKVTNWQCGNLAMWHSGSILARAQNNPIVTEVFSLRSKLVGVVQ